MTSAVISILDSIDRLSLVEQQEIVLELLEKMSGDEALKSMGLSSEFQGLDRDGMRSVLMAKLKSGFEQVQEGLVVDGEAVFDRLQERLIQMERRS